MILRMRRPAQVGAIAACAMVMVWFANGSQAQDKVSAVVGEQTKTEEAARASQKRVTQLDEEATGMLGDYRQALVEAQSLKAYTDQLGAQVKSQNDEIAGMTSQIADIETTSREVLPMMTKMLDTLEQFVKLDMPFLPDERNNRIATLKEMMTRADVSLSEKYRRIVEAYQVEMEYGRTIEAYEGKVGDKTVQFLRTGRVALLYQTLDGKETGYWDVNAKKWVIDSSYNDSITAGLKVAKKQAAPDFIKVPVPAPKEIK
jgi:chromosome segregation ATPase